MRDFALHSLPLLLLLFFASPTIKIIGVRSYAMPSKNFTYASERGQVLGIIRLKKKILNVSGLSPPPSSAADAQSLPLQLQQTISAIVDKFCTNGLVDYDGLRSSKEFQTYLDTAKLLPGADLTALSDSDRRGFFVNLYNAMVIHSIIATGAPSGMFGRLKLYGTSAYKVGGQVLSLNDIENGCLRGNKGGAAPYSDPVTFKAGDPRLSLVLPLDPRIHCALSKTIEELLVRLGHATNFLNSSILPPRQDCGARSCPPLRYYPPGQVDEHLDNVRCADSRSALLCGLTCPNFVITIFRQRRIFVLLRLCPIAARYASVRYSNGLPMILAMVLQP